MARVMEACASTGGVRAAIFRHTERKMVRNLNSKLARMKEEEFMARCGAKLTNCCCVTFYLVVGQ